MVVPFAERVTHHPPVAAPARLWRAVVGQGRRTPRCPATPRLEGVPALVTGGARGIGLETRRGLAARGARVLSAARRPPVAEPGAEPGEDPASVHVPLDLADLDSVAAALEDLAARLAGQPLGVVVANAGLWPRACERSPQGFEKAFATNVLGHFALLEGLRARGLLAEDARVVVVTGDIYVLARACTPDFTFHGARGGQQAYCRSKLGNLWLVHELARRRPQLRVHAVHPGVIATELGGAPDDRLTRFVKETFLLPVEAGAQTPLFCATQPGFVSGGYYHNTLGRVELRPDDPAADREAARALWELLERLAAPGGVLC